MNSNLSSRQIGEIGEDFTCEFLQRKGCVILARNFSIRGGEIDIVAKKGSVIHFVEVKTRKTDPLTDEQFAITKSKISRLVRTAQAYIERHEITLSCVVDVAIVEVSGKEVTDFKYFQRAFTA